MTLWLVLAASGGYILFFTMISLLRRKPLSPIMQYLSGCIRTMRQDSCLNFLVLFPAYQEDTVIVNSVKTFLNQCYDYRHFHVAVISDHMTPDTNRQLAELPVTLLQPVFARSSKAKAMQYAIDFFKAKESGMRGEDFDYVVILDADNVVNIDFLEQLNKVCLKGYQAIQCHRCAKNSDSDIAVLDGVSEEINNTIFRRAHNRIGLSSALIGSGMCFDYEWFCDNVYCLSTAGEDRELEELLLRQRIYVHYEEHIPVYDEKVSSQDNFQRQRLRWMTAQLQSLVRMLPYVPTALMTGNLGYIDKTVQQALIPRSILVVVSLAMAVLMTLLVPVWCLKWWLLAGSVCLSLFLAMPRRLRSRMVFGRLLAMPSLVWKMLMNVKNIDRHSTDFIHTKHEEK